MCAYICIYKAPGRVPGAARHAAAPALGGGFIILYHDN